MKSIKSIGTLFVCLMVLVGCKPADIRALASNSIKVEFNGNQCLPVESFVPSNEEITVSIRNSSNLDFTWYVIIFPIEDAKELQDSKNTYFSASVDAGKSQDFKFIAPTFPARYDTLCVPDNSPENRILKYLLVVEPYPTNTPVNSN